jgi:hypothetical protein
LVAVFLQPHVRGRVEHVALPVVLEAEVWRPIDVEVLTIAVTLAASIAATLTAVVATSVAVAATVFTKTSVILTSDLATTIVTATVITATVVIATIWHHSLLACCPEWTKQKQLQFCKVPPNKS